MARLWDLNLLRFLEFYLMIMFVAGVHLRLRQYQSVVGLIVAVPGRWPRLFKLVREHRTIFLTWSTLLPAGLALSLVLLNSLACRLLWPHANLTVETLLGMPLAVLIALPLGLVMLAFDLYTTVRVPEVDRKLLEKYFDQAEYWLRSWVAPVVHVFTFGYVNPRQMVAAEVRKALEAASKMLNTSLWWMSTQVGLRLAFGLTLWVSYAVTRLGEMPPG